MTTSGRHTAFPGGTALLAVSLTLAGCTADLHDVTGPRVPTENVRGRLVREGVPVADEKVKLELATIDSALVEDRTAQDGTYTFAGVGAGEWTIKVTSRDPDDFPSLTFSFGFASGDSSLTVPDLDLSLHGLEAMKPGDGDSMPKPGFSSPIEFEWKRPDVPGTTVQVRVYGPDGEAVWYGEKLGSEEKARWNGIANRGADTGRPIAPGPYTWRLRVEPADDPIEWTSVARQVVFEAAAP